MPPTLRQATLADAPLITAHRHRMFADNNFAPEPTLLAMDRAFLPWVGDRLADGRYLGLLLCHPDDPTEVHAGAGIHFADFPPHWRHPEPTRAYLLNIYTEPTHRGQGLARQLLLAALAHCRQRGITTITLHASPQGRPLYTAQGFTPTDEMLLTLKQIKHTQQ